MTSARKVQANRANAQASTGPRTAQGKTRAAQNSRRHGLNLPVISDPALSEQVKLFTQEILSETYNSELYQFACDVAEAQVSLIRIRQARQHLLSNSLIKTDRWKAEVFHRNAEKVGMLMSPVLQRLMRSSRRSRSDVPDAFSDSIKQLKFIERYERRALSRRKFAIRAFDLAHRQASPVAGSPTIAADKMCNQ